MDGRAESFIQNGVKGMACCSYHPKGNEDSEIQLFVFEMGDPLKARGKFDSEKPDEAKPTTIGEGAYTAAGSVFVHADKFYTIVNVAQDEPKLAEFALDLAKRVAALQKSKKSSGPTAQDLFDLFPAEPKRSGTKYVAKMCSAIASCPTSSSPITRVGAWSSKGSSVLTRVPRKRKKSSRPT